ncbi:lipoprotein [Sporosarcina sp. NCCP-2716]|uniref:hypothetical protein n=1 Tax=Sporosarcina sp. NCCP-2716 TaxID=2943679 RepID=UPI00203F0942|nr:hypothetical protein [Sporosarcina sp. NCCP-2716]GKV69456.1 lipoprotein [Sporosarcina sp. NCCP-2716]
MKRFLVLGAMGVLLAGCSDSEKADNSKPAEEPGSALEEHAVNTPAENEDDAEQQASEDGDVNATNDSGMEGGTGSDGTADTGDAALEGYEEYSTVRDNAPVDGLKGIVETDNPGTRVILYEDASGVKKVKSIYVKKENRLKVISLDDDGLLYNDVLN